MNIFFYSGTYTCLPYWGDLPTLNSNSSGRENYTESFTNNTYEENFRLPSVQSSNNQLISNIFYDSIKHEKRKNIRRKHKHNPKTRLNTKPHLNSIPDDDSALENDAISRKDETLRDVAVSRKGLETWLQTLGRAQCVVHVLEGGICNYLATFSKDISN